MMSRDANGQTLKFSASVSSAVRSRGDYELAGRTLRREDPRASSPNVIDEIADSLVALALSASDKTSNPNARTAAVQALNFSLLPTKGKSTRYAGAETRLHVIANSSTEDAVRMAAIRGLTGTSDTTRFVTTLVAVAKNTGLSADWAIERLLYRTGGAGVEAARELYVRALVIDPDARLSLGRAATQLGWRR